MQKLMVLVLGLSAWLSMSGCTIPRVCMSTGGMEVTQRENGAASVVVDDKCFSEWLSLKEAVLRRSAAGFLTAGVSLRNVKVQTKQYDRMDDFPIQYRFAWFDTDGIELQGGATQWNRVMLHGGETVQLQSTAPSKDAIKYAVRLRHIR